MFKVSNLFPPESSQWNSIVLHECFDYDKARQILATPIDSMNQGDAFIWPRSSDGVYSVKYGYRCAIVDHSVDLSHMASSSFSLSNFDWTSV